MAQDNNDLRDESADDDETERVISPEERAAAQLDEELAEAAVTARAEPYTPGGKMMPIKTMRIFLLVLAIIIGSGIYAVVYSGRLVVRNQMRHHRALEEMQAKYEQQQEYVGKYGYVPAGETLKPLSSEKKKELDSLRATYGRLPVKLEPLVPPANVDFTTPIPATIPTTVPETEPAS